MARALVVLAEGFEEIEAITPIDVLRRAGVEVVVAGVGGSPVRGAHGIEVAADLSVADALAQVGTLEAIVLPGGMPGAANLAASAEVNVLVGRLHEAGKQVAAICAAPAVTLSPTGVLAGKRATCYPGFEERFAESVEHSRERVVTDGLVTTAQGPGVALEFALRLVELLVSEAKAVELRKGMLVQA